MEGCEIPESELPGLTPAGREVCAGFYYRRDSPVVDLHRAAKYEAHPFAANFLGMMLGERMARLEAMVFRVNPIESCIPLPSHRSKILTRGIDPTHIISMQVALELGIDFSPDVLTRIKLTPSQSTLASEDRRENVSGVFQAVKVEGRNVLLVDDVMTTGATLDEAASTLEGVGYDVTLMALTFRREMFARPDYRKSSTST